MIKMNTLRILSSLIVITLLTTLFAGLTTVPAAAASEWNIETVDSVGDVGVCTSLQLTSTGWPAISYTDTANMDLKYAYKDGGGWHTETADSGGTSAVGGDTSLQLTSAGWPAISYLDGTNYDLKYAYKDEGGGTSRCLIAPAMSV